jgi:hypothetical protein
MRKTACCLAIILLAGVLGAVPAFATFGAIVELPADAIYSPYGGPATVTFTFEPEDAAAIFTARIRRPGHGAIKTKDYFVDPDTQASPHAVTFSWAKLSVAAPTDYVVDIRRQGEDSVITSESFTLLPKLVSELSAQPSPFYPLVQDGYKDRTTIGFSLAADTVETVVRIFEDDAYGRCCGAEIRSESLGPLAAGGQGWIWDGAMDDASIALKGTYFARVSATDTDGVSMVSKAQKLKITKGLIRRTATKQKNGSAYARTAHEQETAYAGDCRVSRVAATHEADILCVNAKISVYWRWGLRPGERIESISFVIQRGIYGCHRAQGHTDTQSFVRVHSPPTSSCSVVSATIKYSYPVQA